MKKLVVGIVVIMIVAIPVLIVRNQAGAPEDSDTDSTADSTRDSQDSDSQNATDESQAVATDTVSIENYAYGPQVITVKKGTTVTWTNQDAMRHDIMPDDESGAFKASELLAKGESYEFTFEQVGTYTYHCSPHPYMKGTVVVTE